jgi:predicted ATPase
LRVRMGLHMGQAELRDGDYFGPEVNRAARLMQVAHGGQIVVSNLIAELMRSSIPSGVTVHALGAHRLRDLTDVDQIFQIVAEGLPDAFPPLHSVEAFRTNLPLQVTSFIGRDEDVAEVNGLLAENRIVTLTGVGGIGKTRLAVQVGAEMLPDFGDGVWLCELGPVLDAAAVPEVVATTLGVRFGTRNAAIGALVDASSQREMLVVLDNCEHVIAASATLTEALVRSCPRVRVLATSREGLGIAGERLVMVRSLTIPSEHVAEHEAEANDAVRLFVDRAASVRRGFALTSESVLAVAQICRRLDGIPLAIELAAARARMMAPREIADRLDERFRLLTGGNRTAIERHQTLRATVDWSYELLTPAQQKLLDRLGVFVGGFTFAAAVAVGDHDGALGDRSLDELGQLVDKSLVIAEDDADGSTRYRLLETIRQYALGHLDAMDDVEPVRRAHASWCAQLARDAEARSRGPGQTEAVRQLEAELENFRAAVSWCMSARETELAVTMLGANFVAHWPNTTSQYALEPWAGDVLGLQGALAQPHAPAVLALQAADDVHRGLMADARAHAVRAVELLGESGRAFSSFPLGVLVRVSLLAGDSSELVDGIHRYLDVARRRGDDYDLAMNLAQSVMAFVFSGRVEEATGYGEEALNVALRTGAPSAIALAAGVLAHLLVETSADRARTLVELSLEHAARVQFNPALLYSLTLVGRLGTDAFDARWAAVLRNLLDRTMQARDWVMVASQLQILAEALIASGRAEEAAPLLFATKSVRSFTDPRALRSRHDELHAQLVETLGAERVARIRSANATLDLDGGVALARDVLDRIIADGPRRAAGDIEWNLENWSRRRAVNP